MPHIKSIEFLLVKHKEGYRAIFEDLSKSGYHIITNDLDYIYCQVADFRDKTTDYIFYVGEDCDGEHMFKWGEAS